MSSPIRCAMLGTGHAHAGGKLDALRNSDDWELAGICEPDPVWKEKCQSQEAYRNVQWLTEAEALEDDSIQMVAVESEVAQILELGHKAIRADKHIHLDKPAGADLEAFKRLLDEARSRNRIVQMGYMFRYNPGFDLLRRAVSEGWLGDIHYLHGTINSNIPGPGRQQLATFSGGMMFELACHLIDMLCLVMGRPDRVTPFLRKDGPFEDNFRDNNVAVLEYARAVALIETSALEQNAFKRRLFEVCGTRGSLIIQPLEPPAVRLCLSQPRGKFASGWQEVELENVPRYIRDVAELARCIRGETDFPYTKAHDYTVQETVLRASNMLS